MFKKELFVLTDRKGRPHLRLGRFTIVITYVWLAYAIFLFPALVIYFVFPGFVQTVAAAFFVWKLIPLLRRGLQELRYARECKNDKKAGKNEIYFATNSRFSAD